MGAQHPVTPTLILQGSNVAYRGRVLLELSTHVETPDGHQRATITPEDIIRVQVSDATPGSFCLIFKGI